MVRYKLIYSNDYEPEGIGFTNKIQIYLPDQLCKYVTITLHHGIGVIISGSDRENRKLTDYKCFYIEKELHEKIIKLFKSGEYDNWKLAINIIIINHKDAEY